MTKNGFYIGFTWVHDGDGRSSKTSACIASYHHPKSITWRWALYWERRKPFGFFKWSFREWGSIGFVFPVIGGLTLRWQETLWRLEDYVASFGEIER